MKNKYLLLITLALLILLSSCLDNILPVKGNGIIESETRRSGLFNSIENSTSIDIIFRKADSTDITIEADENLLKYIITETYNKTLEIKTQPGVSYLDFTDQPLITITSPTLEKVYISGSGVFFGDEISGNLVILNMSGSGNISVDHINCDDLSIMLSGSGNINIKDCQAISSDIFLSGSGSINITGQSEDCYLKVTGSGDIFSETYLLSSASVQISGSGNVFTYVEHDLNGIISGSGNIYLKGNPTINQTISGSGRIIKYK